MSDLFTDTSSANEEETPTAAPGASVPQQAIALELDPFGDDLDDLLGELRDLAKESGELARGEDEPRVRSVYTKEVANLTTTFGKVLLLRAKRRQAERDAQ